MSIQTLDLGKVVGPQGEQGGTGPQGEPGKTMRYGSERPVENTGVDGDVYIVTSTGELFAKENGEWTLITTLQLEGSDIDDELDNTSEKAVQNKVITNAIATVNNNLTSAINAYDEAQDTQTNETISRTSGVSPGDGFHTAYKRGRNVAVIIQTTDTWPFASGNAPYIIPNGYRPFQIVLCPCLCVVNGKYGVAYMTINQAGEVKVASAFYARDASVIQTGTCSSINLFAHYGLLPQ